MCEENKKPSLEAGLEAAHWRELARGDVFGMVCDRADAYYAVATFYSQEPKKLWCPLNLLEFLRCFYKAKMEVQPFALQGTECYSQNSVVTEKWGQCKNGTFVCIKIPS